MPTPTAFARWVKARPEQQNANRFTQPRKSHPVIKTHSKGNLAEYMLPALMIGGLVLISITGLMQSNLFQNTQTQALLQANGISKDAQGKALLNIKTMGQNPFYQPYQYKTADGKLITIPNFPTDLAAAVEVDGGHGTTEKLLAAMEAWIQAMVDSGEITPNEANTLRDLANQGHTIAANIKIYENVALSCGESKECVQNKLYGNKGVAQTNWNLVITYPQEKQEYGSAQLFQPSPSEIHTIYELSPLQKNIISTLDLYRNNVDNIVIGNTAMDFIQKYEVAKENLTSASPQSLSLLKYFSSNILNLGFSSASSIHEAGWEQGTEGRNILNSHRQRKFSDTNPQDFNAILAAWTQVSDKTSRAELTHTNANGICQMGQGEARATECQ
jgi:hypothetical protein